MLAGRAVIQLRLTGSWNGTSVIFVFRCSSCAYIQWAQHFGCFTFCVFRILCLHVLVAQMFNERISPAWFNKSSAQIIATIRQRDMPTKPPEPYAQFYRRSDLNSFGTALRRTLNRELFSSQVQALTGCTIVPLPPAIIAYRAILSPVR